MISDINFWRRFSADLHIDDSKFLDGQSVLDISDKAIEGLKDRIISEGYFQLPPQELLLPLDKMAEVITRLHKENIPITFAFIYDEFWILYLRYHKLLCGILGSEYTRRPLFLAWRIDPLNNDAGFSPHRDYSVDEFSDNGLPTGLSFWIPLTDATPFNGCIHVVPANLDPTYNTPDRDIWKFAIQDIQCLPCNAGGAIAWDFSIIHWGGRSNPRAEHPRISVAFEFQTNKTDLISSQISDPLSIPTFETRIKYCSRQTIDFSARNKLSAADLEFYKSYCGGDAD